MSYMTYLIVYGEFRHNKNIKIANFKRKCNPHDHKIQYLSGSDTKLLSKLLQVICHIISHNTTRGKKADRKVP